jgi:hydroxymethylglutaryl-CoA lyase
MVLVVNKKGAEILSNEKGITHISYPHSISPTFLKKNLNASTEQSLVTVNEIAELCEKTGKQLVIYISMAFGNPYGDPWNTEILAESIRNLTKMGVRIIPLSNVAIEIDDHLIKEIFNLLIPEFPAIEFGLHLHTTNRDWVENVAAAYHSGCRRFDSVINGYGGCPMSGKEMLGNLMTENLITFAGNHGLTKDFNISELEEAYKLALLTFSEPASFSNDTKSIQ